MKKLVADFTLRFYWRYFRDAKIATSINTMSTIPPKIYDSVII